MTHDNTTPRQSRRDFLAAGLAAVSTASLGQIALKASPSEPPPFKPGKAKSVIQIWMWGGPSHLDTFDPKPGAGREFCGQLDEPITTNVPNIEISQTLPLLAQCADQYSIIRTVTHGSNHHETAAYIMQTGRVPGGGLVCPSIGAVITKKAYDNGYDSQIPPYVLLTTSLGRFSESGFLGSRYRPFVTGGDPSRNPFLVSGYVVQGITDERRQNRQQLLESLNTFGRIAQDAPFVEEVGTAREHAHNLITGDAAKLFNLSTEPENIREEYGMNWFGQSCLMARRLAAVGVPFITINYRGWDTHRRHFDTLTQRQGEWDRGLSMLLKDLGDTGLLDSTIVWWGGEFGRTPKINWDSPWFGGRGHHSRCFNMLLAGGGFQGGKVVGQSNDEGMQVASRPVAPQDLLGSIYQQMGIDPDAKMPNDRGIDITNMPPASEAGRLYELMG